MNEGEGEHLLLTSVQVWWPGLVPVLGRAGADLVMPWSNWGRLPHALQAEASDRDGDKTVGINTMMGSPGHQSGRK